MTISQKKPKSSPPERTQMDDPNKNYAVVSAKVSFLCPKCQNEIGTPDVYIVEKEDVFINPDAGTCEQCEIEVHSRRLMISVEPDEPIEPSTT